MRITQKAAVLLLVVLVLVVLMLVVLVVLLVLVVLVVGAAVGAAVGKEVGAAACSADVDDRHGQETDADPDCFTCTRATLLNPNRHSSESQDENWV